MRTDANGAGLVDYEPNSFGGPYEYRAASEPPLRIDGSAARYAFSASDEDLYGQPHLFWVKVLDDEGRRTLIDNVVRSLSNPNMGISDPVPIQERMLTHWFHIHQDLGSAIARGLGLCHLI
jgi:catalase